MNSNLNRVLNIAHRGARSLAPENTILAARKAVAAGADMWELDVTMSADGELVILHDDTLERTSNAREVFPERSPWNVSDFTMEELRRLDFGSWFAAQDPYGQIAAAVVSKEEQERFQGTAIPTLQEALEFTRDYHWRINVEIKDATGLPADKDIVERVVRMIDQLNMAPLVLISSFNHSYLERSKAANPMIATGALIEAPVNNPAELLAKLEAQALNPSLALTTPEMISDLRSRGYDVYVWTVNDEKDMRALIEAGVSGIITDFPQLLHKVIGA